MNFPEAVRSGFRNYVNFNGRASRSEFWFWALFSWIASAGVSGIFGGVDSAFWYSIPSLIGLVLLLPSLAVAVRRLHDTGKSALWLLVNLIPVAGPFIFLDAMLGGSRPGNNQYGPNPLGIYNANDYQSQQYLLPMANGVVYNSMGQADHHTAYPAQLPAPSTFPGYGFNFDTGAEPQPVPVAVTPDPWAQQFNQVHQQAVQEVPSEYRRHFFTDQELASLRAGHPQAVLLEDNAGDFYLAEVGWNGQQFTETRLDITGGL